MEREFKTREVSHGSEKDSQPVPPRQSVPPRQVKIYTVLDDKIIHVAPENLKPLVQRVTGKPPTAFENGSGASQGILSPGPSSMPSISPDFFYPTPLSVTHLQGGRVMTDEEINELVEQIAIDDTFPDYLDLSVSDGYWNQQRHHQPPISHGGPPKRHRSDFEGPPSSGHDMHTYFSRDEDRGIPRSVKDTRTIDSAYDRYLQSVQTSSVPSEEGGPFNGVGLGRPGGNTMMHRPSMDDLMTGRGGILPPDFGPNGRPMGFAQEDLVARPSRQQLRLPPDASNTLYVEGLPPNCSQREVAHIFRPFLGYREVRLVTKDSKQRNGDPIVLCFVDFDRPECAATALTALQGYQMDENDPDSKILRLQFSRNPGPRPGQRGGRR